jgi:heat shock protein HslJ
MTTRMPLRPVCRWRAGVGLVVLGLAVGVLASLASGQAMNNSTPLFEGAYLSTAVTKGGEPHPLFEGTDIRVEFEDGEHHETVQWRADCNDFGARVDITDERLITGQISGTEIGCPAALVQQDEWMGRFFGSDPKWLARQDRTLRLTSGARVVKLRRPAQP